MKTDNLEVVFNIKIPLQIMRILRLKLDFMGNLPTNCFKSTKGYFSHAWIVWPVVWRTSMSSDILQTQNVLLSLAMEIVHHWQLILYSCNGWAFQY